MKNNDNENVDFPHYVKQKSIMETTVPHPPKNGRVTVICGLQKLIFLVKYFKRKILFISTNSNSKHEFNK